MIKKLFPDEFLKIFKKKKPKKALNIFKIEKTIGDKNCFNVSKFDIQILVENNILFLTFNFREFIDYCPGDHNGFERHFPGSANNARFRAIHNGCPDRFPDFSGRNFALSSSSNHVPSFTRISNHSLTRWVFGQLFYLPKRTKNSEILCKPNIFGYLKS